MYNICWFDPRIDCNEIHDYILDNVALNEKGKHIVSSLLRTIDIPELIGKNPEYEKHLRLIQARIVDYAYYKFGPFDRDLVDVQLRSTEGSVSCGHLFPPNVYMNGRRMVLWVEFNTKESFNLFKLRQPDLYRRVIIVDHGEDYE